MRELTEIEVAEISGGGIERGTICGFNVGAMIGGALLFGPLVGSLIFMFTPLACVIDYGRNR